MSNELVMVGLGAAIVLIIAVATIAALVIMGAVA